MQIKIEYVLFGVLGLVALYALSKVRSPEVQQVPEFVGSLTPQASGGVDSGAREASRLGAFQALAGLGAAQTQAEVTRYQTNAQLEATRVQSSLAETLGLGEFSSRERMQRAEYEQRNKELPLTLDLQRYGIDAQVRQFVEQLNSQKDLYALDFSNRQALQAQQIAAIERTAREYRNQSLERAGTYLNALQTAWNQGSTYNYQDAFGGPRPPSILSQLIQAGTKLAGGFLGI